jgi:hypothetical protein
VNTGTATAGDLPAGPYLRVEALGAGLDLGSAGSVRADLSFERTTTAAGLSTVVVGISGATFSVLAGGSPLAQLVDGSGAVLLSGTGGWAGALRGSVVLSVPGVSLTGALALELSNLGTDVDQVVTVGGTALPLVLPAATSGSYLRLVGTDVVLEVLGQRLSATRLQLTQTTSGASIALTGVQLRLGGGLLTVTGGSALLTAEATGLHGTFTGAVAVAAPGVGFSADLTVAVDTRPASRSVAVRSDDVVLTVGGQALRAKVSFTSATSAAGSTVVTGSIEDVGGGHPLLVLGSSVSVPTASGRLVLTSAGLALDLSATVAVTLPGIAFAVLAPGYVRVQLNTSSSAIDTTVDGVRVALPAGPFTSVRVVGATLTLGSGVELRGTFAFEQRGGTTVVAATGVEVAVSVGGTSARLVDGEGAVVVIPAVTSGASQNSGGIAGYLSGRLDVAAGGLTAGARVVLRLNTSNKPVDSTVEVGGRTVAVTFEAGDVFAVSVLDATLTIGDLVTIEGSLAWQNGVALNGGGTGDVVAGEGLTVFIGRGPARLGTGGLNPLAVGVLLTDARIALVRIGSGATATYALVATGTVSLVGIPGVTLTGGTVSVRVNTTGRAIDEVLTIAGSTAPGTPSPSRRAAS